ncbi:MAG: PAS domain S-box protein [Rhodospirillales bacterium]|nr:PAS domain S-box protein [Rhodospirillales bacterium]
MKVSPRRDWGMLFALFLVLTVVAVTLGGVAIWTLYSAGLEHEKKSLAAVVKIEVDRIEAAIRSEQTPIDDLKLIPPLGESGELFVFRQDVEGPEVIRHWANHVTSLSSADREAIVNSDMFRLALSGQSGIHEGRDFRGNEVVAAYAPVAGLGMGVVGKIDISEFRAPFFTAAQGVAGVSIVLIALGTVVFLYLSDSILQRIRAGEARFRELFEHLNSGVAIYLYSDQDGKLTVKDLNRAAEQILNVDRSAVVGLSVAEAFPGLKAAGLTDVLYRVAKSGEVEQFPEWFYHDERGSGWRKSYVFRLPSGEVVSLFDDITKKKKNEEELRESEARWRSIFDLQSVATIIVDREKKIRFLNRAAEALFGYPNEKLVGVPFGYPVLGGDVAQIDIVRPTGSVVYAEMETIPMQWGGEEHHLLFLRDVSAHRRAEGDLRKLFQAIEQSPAAVVITNIEGNIEYVNPKFTEVSGYAYPEVVGKNPRILKSGLTPPEVYEDLWKTITRGDVWVGEFQNKRKSGEFCWELASIAPS